MFIDELQIEVTGGKGGDGCTSFRREKCVPMGGPDGASGGHGSNIIFRVEKGLRTLIDLRYMKIIKGDKGENGKGSNRTGSNAKDIVINVPEGTTIIDKETGLVIADLVGNNSEVIVAHGGRGGRGNVSFASQKEPAPKMSEYGEPGEHKVLLCELKVLADVGLVGFPSVGKSTLLSIISASKPKIAAYHFTTLSPNLGVVTLKDRRTFIMADLPGLIAGASNGVGLGDRFLKHAMRTRIIAHVISMSGEDYRDPIEDYKVIRDELASYDERLKNKKEVVVASKMDVPGADENLEKFKKSYPYLKVFPISAINNTGIDELLVYLADTLDVTSEEEIYNKEDYVGHVVYKFENILPFSITKDNNCWIVSGSEIDKLFYMTKFNEEESVERFSRKLKGMGVDEELLKLGAKPGDDVAILDYVFTFKA